MRNIPTFKSYDVFSNVSLFSQSQETLISLFCAIVIASHTHLHTYLNFQIHCQKLYYYNHTNTRYTHVTTPNKEYGTHVYNVFRSQIKQHYHGRVLSFIHSFIEVFFASYVPFMFLWQVYCTSVGMYVCMTQEEKKLKTCNL